MSGKFFVTKGWKILLIGIMVFNLFFAIASPADAATSSCANHYLVVGGDTLYKIGVRYGVYWPDIASLNGIGYPYIIYVGQTLCIPKGGTTPNTVVGSVGVAVTSVVKDVSINIKMMNLPKKEAFNISIGKCYSSSSTHVDTFRTDGQSGNFFAKYKIPNKYDGIDCLVVYLESTSSDRSASASFMNTSGSTTPYYTPPTSTTDNSNLWFKVINSRRNHTVSIRIYNAIRGEKYYVYIGPEGTGAWGGKWVATIIPNTKNDFKIQLSVPRQYKGEQWLDIRIHGVTVKVDAAMTYVNKNK